MINKVNFALLDFINHVFAPRFSNINNRIKNLCGFKNLKEYENLLIKPNKKINEKLITEEWDNIQRIVASLISKKATQSLIVKKLSSYKKNDKTKQALWEYNNIIESIYMLNYIDDLNIRRNVQNSLNRGENYHQMKKSIALINGKTFRGKSLIEIEIWDERSRILANSILYYNCFLLSEILKKKDNNSAIVPAVKAQSPASWRHINFLGKYEFESAENFLDIDKMISEFNFEKYGPM